MKQTHPFEDFLPGTHFLRIIPEAGAPSNDTSNVQRLVLCTGKVYYDLLAARKHVEKENNVAYDIDLVYDVQAAVDPSTSMPEVEKQGCMLLDILLASESTALPTTSPTISAQIPSTAEHLPTTAVVVFLVTVRAQ